MIEFIYIPIILFLYLRTWKYNVLIDDQVKRDGYMYVITTTKPDPKLFEKRRSILATITNIGVFIACCSYIHYLWGWKAALLFAVFPLNVSGVAWATGNYYMSSVLLILFCLSLQTAFGFCGSLLAALPFAAALNSTLSAIPYVFISLFFPAGWIAIWPLVAFIKGKRMKAGLTQRKAHHENIGVEAGKFKLANLLNCPKIIAYYIALSLFPNRLGFFHSYGSHKSYFTVKRMFMCCTLCLAFWCWGLTINPFMIFWWFLFIAIFSQYVIYGQFTAERYTYISNVAFCVLLSQFITNDIVFTVLATLWFYRSLDYIPAWKHNVNLFSYSISQQPEAPENYGNLGCYYLDSSRYYEALKPLLIAERLAIGAKYVIKINIASCFIHMGERGDISALRSAYIWTKKAMEEAPKDKMEELQKQLNIIHNKTVDSKRNIRKMKRRGK